jgi:plastocyanin
MLAGTRILLGATLLLTVGCAGVPNTSRTGEIYDVKFADHMIPSELQVQPGDEVRWVNHRTMPVTIDFLGGALNELSCERGFSNFLGRPQESISVGPNQSVSLCFAKTALVSYNVRMDSPVPGGKLIESGAVHVGPPIAR